MPRLADCPPVSQGGYERVFYRGFECCTRAGSVIPSLILPTTATNDEITTVSVTRYPTEIAKFENDWPFGAF